MDEGDSVALAASFQRSFLAGTSASRAEDRKQREFAAALEKCDPRAQVAFLLATHHQFKQHVREKEKEKGESNTSNGKQLGGEQDGTPSKAEGVVKPAEETKASAISFPIQSAEDEEERSRQILVDALETIDKSERDRLFCAQSWLANLLVAVETLPVCVSIATADPQRRGFPLIYVNSCFEATSGYTREEIVGQNCRFLQAGKAEAESVQRMSIALRDAKPVKVNITNYRKDGMPFRNLLSMKPIFDENGVYSYVVGIQFDVTAEDATPKRLKMADDLMKMLPDVIPIDSSSS